MSVVRAALMLSLGIIISVGIVVLFLHQKDRFTIVPQNKGIFVFDYKNSSLSFCGTTGCKLISVNNDYNRSAAETYFSPHGYMAPSQQMGFMNPQMMQQNPYLSPQYPPYMQPASPYQQNFGSQSGWQNPQPAPVAPAQPMQQQQPQAAPQEPAPQMQVHEQPQEQPQQVEEQQQAPQDQEQPQQ